MKISTYVRWHPEDQWENPSTCVLYRVDDALQGLETIVDRKDVVLTVRYGRELRRDTVMSRFGPSILWIFDKPSTGSPVFR